MKTVIIDGELFSDLSGFYDEAEKVLTRDLGWRTGRNLNAFNDLLRGGFNVFDDYENIKLVWKNFSKSRKDLGKDINTIEEIINSHEHIEFIKY